MALRCRHFVTQMWSIAHAMNLFALSNRFWRITRRTFFALKNAIDVLILLISCFVFSMPKAWHPRAMDANPWLWIVISIESQRDDIEEVRFSFSVSATIPFVPCDLELAASPSFICF